MTKIHPLKYTALNRGRVVPKLAKGTLRVSCDSCDVLGHSFIQGLFFRCEICQEDLCHRCYNDSIAHTDHKRTSTENLAARKHDGHLCFFMGKAPVPWLETGPENFGREETQEHEASIAIIRGRKRRQLRGWSKGFPQADRPPPPPPPFNGSSPVYRGNRRGKV